MTRTRTRSKRKLLFWTGSIGVLAASVVAGAVAWACVAVSSMELSPAKGGPGTLVKGTGSGFSTRAEFSNVDIHWGGPDGPVLATWDKKGTMNFQFTVPDVAPGTYVVTATQKDGSGAPAWGTPARATFLVPGNVGKAPSAKGGDTPGSETVAVDQRHVVESSGPNIHVSGPAPGQPGASGAPAAAQSPAAVPSLEAQDAINEKVAPVGSRRTTYVPASSRTQGESTLPLRAGLGLAGAGVIALLTAVGAVLILRSATGTRWSR